MILSEICANTFNKVFTDLQKRRSLSHPVLCPPPAHHKGVLTHEVLPQTRQTHGDNVLLDISTHLIIKPLTCHN